MTGPNPESQHLDNVQLENRLTALEAARPWSPRVVSKLESLVRSGDDYDLFRINPLLFAVHQGVEERESIDLFLHAAHVGLFAMEWLIVCGACSNVFTSFRELGALDPHFTCTLCTNQNEADLDSLIQIAFTVSPEVRRIIFHDPDSLSVEDFYFKYHYSSDVKPLPSGLTVPETLQEWTKLLGYLEPGESTSVDLDLPRSFIGVWDPLSPISAIFAAEPDPEVSGARLNLEIADGSITDLDGRDLVSMQLEIPEGRSLYMPPGQDSAVAAGNPPPDGGESEQRVLKFDIPAIAQIPTGPLALSVRNAGTRKASVWVVQYPPVPQEGAFVEFEPVLTAKRLLSNQTFRDLFRSETVPESETLQVKDLTYLFTDLKDSTLMYDEVGDVNAYDLVRRHFDALVRVVAENSGAVTKTIGDSIMATFVHPSEAVRAAIGMQSVLAEFNATASTNLVIKIGIHRGRSIAVNLNDQIDYFGQEINIASRIQELADAGEVVISEPVHDSQGVETLLEPFDVGKEDGIMKGVSDTIAVYRVKTEHS